jgi:hypothetical protein
VADPALVTTGPEDVLHLLRSAELTVEGRLVDASNATLYCSAELDGATVAVVYKPVRGERPLWDFPDGTLAGREVAAYLVSEATGWDVVPPTVLREGPFGTGMVQLWVDVDESVDLAVLARSDHPDLRRMAVFDAVVNNADRKGGHLLPRPTAGCWAWTTASASPPRTSCGPCCGSGAAGRCRTRRWRCSRSCAPCWRASWGLLCSSC